MILNQNSLDPPHIWDKWAAAGRGQYEESSPALITPRFRHNKTQLRFTPVLNHIFHLSSFRDPHSLVSLARLGHILRSNPPSLHVSWVLKIYPSGAQIYTLLMLLLILISLTLCILMWTPNMCGLIQTLPRYTLSERRGENQNIVCDNLRRANWP